MSSVDGTSKPNVVVAIVLGLLAPAAGLWYAGWPRAAAAIIVLFLASVVGLPYLAVSGAVDVARLPTLLAVTALLAWGPAALCGAVAAVRATPAPKRPAWVHPWWVLGVVVLTWSSSSALRARVVVPYLVSLAPVDPETATRLDLRSGGLVVVKRRYAPNEISTGALVLVGERLGRVKSTTSGIELDDGSRVSPADVVGVAFLAR